MSRQYLLDSNTVSDLYNLSALAYAPICRRLASLKSDEKVYVSILTLYELEYGFAHAPDNKKAKVRQQINQAQQDFEILPLSREGAKLFGILKQTIKEARNLNNLVTTLRVVMQCGRSASSAASWQFTGGSSFKSLDAERPVCITTRSVVTR